MLPLLVQENEIGKSYSMHRIRQRSAVFQSENVYIENR